jgi:hypothetical protein
MGSTRAARSLLVLVAIASTLACSGLRRTRIEVSTSGPVDEALIAVVGKIGPTLTEQGFRESASPEGSRRWSGLGSVEIRAAATGGSVEVTITEVYSGFHRPSARYRATVKTVGDLLRERFGEEHVAQSS